MDTPGYISTIAGGSRGYAGDGGPAQNARFGLITAIDSDARGNLYVADSGNHRIRRIDALTGVIKTVAGNGEYAVPPAGATAMNTGLPFLVDLEVVGESLLFVGARNNQFSDDRTLWKIDLESGALEQVRIESEGESAPAAIGLDGLGRVYFTHRNEGIRRLDPQTEAIEVVANGSTFLAFAVVDSNRILILTKDVPNGSDFLYRLVLVDNGRGVVEQIAGPFPPPPFPMADEGLQVFADIADTVRFWDMEIGPDGALYVLDASASFGTSEAPVVGRISLDSGRTATVAGTGARGHAGDGGAALEARLFARDIAIDAGGNLYLAGGDATQGFRIRKVNAPLDERTEPDSVN